MAPVAVREEGNTLWYIRRRCAEKGRGEGREENANEGDEIAFLENVRRGVRQAESKQKEGGGGEEKRGQGVKIRALRERLIKGCKLTNGANDIV